MVAETPTVEQIADIVGLALVQFSETRRLRKMVPIPDEREPLEPKRSVPDFQRALSDLSNSELLSALDLTLLKLERRFYRYAHEGRRSWRWPMRSCCWHQGPGRDSSRPCQLPSIPGSSASGRSGRVESHQNQPLVGRRAAAERREP